ncbi:ABC transporter substrate-binding protein, partial [Chloroflexota bacterium]
EGTFTWGNHFKNFAACFDPRLTTKSTEFLFLYAWCDALVKSMPEGSFTPSLATSWSMSPDGLTYTFNLRKGVKFHNGDEMTAEDVKFSYDRYEGNASDLLRERISRVEIVDPYTINFVLKAPWNDFMEYYAGTGVSGASWIVPKKYVEEVGNDEFVKHPIGAGPYKVVSVEPGVNAVMEAYEDYWRKVPHVKTMVFDAVAERSTNFAKLKVGEVDVAMSMKGPLAAAVMEDPDMTYYSSRSASVLMLIPAKQWDPQSPWSNVKVRQAASLALDRQVLVDSVFPGSLIPGQFMPDEMFGVKKFPVDPYDEEKAKQLLADAGYPNGFDGGKFYGVNTYSDTYNVAVTYWNNIGINVELELYDNAVYYQKAYNGELDGIIFDSTSGGVTAAYRVWRLVEDISGHYGQYDDITALNEQQKVEQDPTKRADIINQIQQLVHDQYMVIPLHQNANPCGVGLRVKAHMMGASASPCWWPAPYEDVELWPDK